MNLLMVIDVSSAAISKTVASLDSKEPKRRALRLIAMPTNTPDHLAERPDPSGHWRQGDPDQGHSRAGLLLAGDATAELFLLSCA